jgi:translation initiation factor 2A
MHKYPSNVTPPNATSYPALLSKSLYQADEVTVHWSPKGDTALTTLQTSVNTSGES